MGVSLANRAIIASQADGTNAAVRRTVYVEASWWTLAASTMRTMLEEISTTAIAKFSSHHTRSSRPLWRRLRCSASTSAAHVAHMATAQTVAMV